MSELTPCNHCSLNRIKRRAEKDGLQVTIKREGDGWTTVYVHPLGMIPLNEHRVASMMKITNHCVC